MHPGDGAAGLEPARTLGAVDPLPVLVALAVMLLVACAPAGEAPTEDATTVASPAGSPTPASPEAATAARSLHLIGCDPVDPEVEIVCEAYDLVRRHYVDRVPDQDLARAAARGRDRSIST